MSAICETEAEIACHVCARFCKRKRDQQYQPFERESVGYNRSWNRSGYTHNGHLSHLSGSIDHIYALGVGKSAAIECAKEVCEFMFLNFCHSLDVC